MDFLTINNPSNFLPQPPLTKTKLSKNDITLEFILSRLTQEGYKIRFLVRIMPMALNGLQSKNIDMVSLHDAIIANIDSFDKKYVTLKSFDTLKCEFVFDFNKWFKDALKDVTPKTYFSKFNQEYRLKIQPPKMILFDTMRSLFFDYITKEFKNYIVKNNKDKKWFGHLLPSEFQKRVNVRLANMFEYEYDYMNNRFLINLKSVYVIGASMLTGFALKEIKKQSFADRVEKNPSNTSKEQWKKYITKKFI